MKRGLVGGKQGARAGIVAVGPPGCMQIMGFIGVVPDLMVCAISV